MLKNKKYCCEEWSDNSLFCLKIDKVLYKGKSKYQKIEFFKNKEFGTFFTLDDFMMVNEKDECAYHEMITHSAFSVNPNIKNILIIGGGDGGTSRELVKYDSVKNIDFVEIDEKVVKLSLKYLPKLSSQILTDKRIKLFFEDGVNFVNEAKDNTYDLVIVDSTDPISIGEGLFTLDFYKNIKRILTPKGILINQSESAFFDQYAAKAKQIHEKLNRTFKITKPFQFQAVSYASGTWMFSFSSDYFEPEKELQKSKWNQLEIKTNYFNIDFYSASFKLPNYVYEKLNINNEISKLKK